MMTVEPKEVPPVVYHAICKLLGQRDNGWNQDGYVYLTHNWQNNHTIQRYLNDPNFEGWFK